jgi:hypothetical protein
LAGLAALLHDHKNEHCHTDRQRGYATPHNAKKKFSHGVCTREPNFSSTEPFLAIAVLISPAAGQREGRPMKDYSEIWALAAGTLVAVSIASGIAYIVAGAI